MTRTRRLVLKISVRNKWQFTLIRKKLTPRTGIIQWRLNKLEGGADRNKKKLHKDKWEVVQSSAENVFLSGTQVRGQDCRVCPTRLAQWQPIPGGQAPRVTAVQLQSTSSENTHHSRRETEKTRCCDAKTVRWAREGQKGAKCYCVDLSSLIG